MVKQLILHSDNTVTQIRFKSIRGGGYNSDMAIDDISLQETPTCMEPSNLEVTNITIYTADLSWVDNNNGYSLLHN